MTSRLEESEFDLVRRLFAPLSRAAPGAFGLRNDGATVAPPAGATLVVTKDLMVAGVHYPPDEEPAVVARRLLRVNLSDLAAMGADALSYALGLALPRDLPASWIEGFAGGLALDQAHFGVALIGGDMVAGAGPAVLSLTAFGAVPQGAVLMRAGGAAGDDLYVSGTIGDAALGLRVARGGLRTLAPADRAFLAERFRLPSPRLALGQALRGVASAALDVSDGLIADLAHLCEESGVAARVSAEAVPLSAAAAAARALASPESGIADLLAGGDDYELLFAVPLARRGAVEALGRALGLPLARIGALVPGRGVRVLDAAGRPLSLERTGYRHAWS